MASVHFYHETCQRFSDDDIRAECNSLGISYSETDIMELLTICCDCRRYEKAMIRAAKRVMRSDVKRYFKRKKA